MSPGFSLETCKSVLLGVVVYDVVVVVVVTMAVNYERKTIYVTTTFVSTSKNTLQIKNYYSKFSNRKMKKAKTQQPGSFLFED